jgi:hypothetical protein
LLLCLIELVNVFLEQFCDDSSFELLGLALDLELHDFFDFLLEKFLLVRVLSLGHASALAIEPLEQRSF